MQQLVTYKFSHQHLRLHLRFLVTYKFSHQHLPLTAATSPDFTANADTVSKAPFAVLILLNLCIHAVYLCWCVYQNMNIATESMNYVQLVAKIGNFYFNALRTSHHCNCTLSNCSFHCIVRVLANLYLSSAGRAMAESWSFPSPRWPTSKLEPSTILQNAIYQTVYNFANFVEIGEQIFRC